MSEKSMGINAPRFFGFGGGGGNKSPEKPVSRPVVPAQKEVPPRTGSSPSLGTTHGLESSGNTGSSVTHTPIADVARQAEQSPIPENLPLSAQALAKCFVGDRPNMSRTWADLSKGLQEGIRSFSASVAKAEAYSGIPGGQEQSTKRWSDVWTELEHIVSKVEAGSDRWELLQEIATTNP